MVCPPNGGASMDIICLDGGGPAGGGGGGGNIIPNPPEGVGLLSPMKLSYVGSVK